MADGTVRKFPLLTYAKVLELLQDGVIVVCPFSCTITMRGRALATQLDRQQRYLFVRLYWRGSRRGIAVHRLVWMAKHNKVVPDGYDVHHKDRDSFNNAITNLQLREMHGHRSEASRGYPADWDTVRDEESEWEEFVQPLVA